MEIDFLEALIFVSLVILWLSIYENRRKKTVWILDDDANTLTMFQHILRVKRCKFEYFSDLKPLAKDLIFKKPDAVVVDYFLSGKTNGGHVYKFCKNNGIPCVIVTASDQEIFGVPKKSIFKKGTNTFFKDVEHWIEKSVAA